MLNTLHMIACVFGIIVSLLSWFAWILLYRVMTEYFEHPILGTICLICGNIISLYALYWFGHEVNIAII